MPQGLNALIGIGDDALRDVDLLGKARSLTDEHDPPDFTIPKPHAQAGGRRQGSAFRAASAFTLEDCQAGCAVSATPGAAAKAALMPSFETLSCTDFDGAI